MVDRADEPWLKAYEAGTLAHPSVRVEVRDFLAFARAAGLTLRANDDGAEAVLAYACAAGCPRAIAAFEASYAPVARAAIARVHAEDAFVDDALQAFRRKFLVGPPPAIARYSGRSPLRVWLRVAASRVALDALRTSPRRAAPLDELAGVLEGGALDPALAQLSATSEVHFRAALRAAVASLSVRERNLLRLHYLDGLTIDALAAPLGVHRATVARMLSALATRLSERVYRELKLRFPGATRAEIESLWRAVQSHVRLGISSLLGAVPRAGVAQLRELP